jgi:hypothetical protein
MRHAPDALAFLDHHSQVRGEPLPLLGRQRLIHRLGDRRDLGIARAVQERIPRLGLNRPDLGLERPSLVMRCSAVVEKGRFCRYLSPPGLEPGTASLP